MQFSEARAKAFWGEDEEDIEDEEY